MQVKPKELGENIIVNLDYQNYKLFLDQVKKFAKECEYKSNYKKLDYSVVFNGRKRPYMDVKGWCSRVIDKRGKISHVTFMDYDQILFNLMESELKYLIQTYNLTPFYIFTTHEEKDENGEYYGNYIAVSITKRNVLDVLETLKESHCDNSYKLVPLSYRFKTWVLRLSGKGSKKQPEFKCVIGDTKKKYSQQVSQAHLELMEKVYKLPKINYLNLDGGNVVFTSEYKTASE